MANSTYFRVSVTSQCNLACRFCHREGNFAGGGDITPEEIRFACKAALNAGFTKFKLTGGEPTERADLDMIVSLLSELRLPDLSMITNGTNLTAVSQRLFDAGLRRINVTVNTLDERRFRQFRPREGVSVRSVTEGIETARRVGFDNMKINFVFYDQSCEDDLKALIKFVKESGLTLVLLPVMDADNAYSLADMYELVSAYGILSEETIQDNEGLRKRKIRLRDGGCVLLRIDELAEKKPFSFCETCLNASQCREGIFPIRLSSNGQLIPCLADAEHRIDVRGALRKGDEKEMADAFAKIALWQGERFLSRGVKND